MKLRMLAGIPVVLLLVCGVAFGQSDSLDQFANSLAPTVPSPHVAIQRMLEMANLKPTDTLYDLGCGDGRILIAAAEQYHVKAVGVEISERMARKAAEKVKKAGLQNEISIVHGNFLYTDLSRANVVTLYLATSANASLKPTLERSLRPKSRVISYDYPIPGWRAINTSETTGATGDTHVIYLYEVPDSVRSDSPRK